MTASDILPFECHESSLLDWRVSALLVRFTFFSLLLFGGVGLQRAAPGVESDSLPFTASSVAGSVSTRRAPPKRKKPTESPMINVERAKTIALRGISLGGLPFFEFHVNQGSVGWYSGHSRFLGPKIWVFQSPRCQILSPRMRQGGCGNKAEPPVQHCGKSTIDASR